MANNLKQQINYHSKIKKKKKKKGTERRREKKKKKKGRISESRFSFEMRKEEGEVRV